MDTIQTIMERRSIRRYAPQPLPEDDLRQIMEAGRQAPSAANRQPWHFVVVTDAKQRYRVAEACNNQMWMAEAGAIIVAIGLPAASEKWYPVDVSIAMQNMVLAAWNLGYGTCWIGAFSEAQVKEVCGIPDDLRVVACTPVGIPAIQATSRGRKAWDEVFSIDMFGNPAQ